MTRNEFLSRPQLVTPYLLKVWRNLYEGTPPAPPVSPERLHSELKRAFRAAPTSIALFGYELVNRDALRDWIREAVAWSPFLRHYLNLRSTKCGLLKVSTGSKVCENCKLPRGRHAGKKCLFAPTEFKELALELEEERWELVRGVRG